MRVLWILAAMLSSNRTILLFFWPIYFSWDLSYIFAVSVYWLVTWLCSPTLNRCCLLLLVHRVFAEFSYLLSNMYFLLSAMYPEECCCCYLFNETQINNIQLWGQFPISLRVTSMVEKYIFWPLQRVYCFHNISFSP